MQKHNTVDKGGIKKLKSWMEWKCNSCRFDSFITLYLFGIKPFIYNLNDNNYLKNKELLYILNKTVDILKNNPNDECKDNYWSYIDNKRLNGDNEEISFFGEFGYITGLFRTFKDNINFGLRIRLNEKCMLINCISKNIEYF